MSDHWAKPFSCIPVAAAKDERLTKTALRVMIALASHANRLTGACTIKLETLAAETGLATCKVATATVLLVRLGWLQKVGISGRSRPSTYHLMVPKTITEAVTVTKAVPETPETFTEAVTVTYRVTVTESITVTKTVPETPETLIEAVPKTLTEAVKGKEQINYLDKERRKR